MFLYRLLKTNDCATNDPFVSNNVVEVYPVVFFNDGTVLKLSIQFDKKRNVNVWSEMHDMTYIKCKCKSEPFLEREVLLKKIVCEAVVSSVTSLDNNFFC